MGTRTSTFQRTTERANIAAAALAVVVVNVWAAMSPGWSWVVPSGLSTVVIGILVWVNFVRPKCRSRGLKKPISAYFVKPETGERRLHCVTVQANSECTVHLRIQMHMQFEESQMVFGFDGDREKRPIPQSVVNSYVHKGSEKYQSPDTHTNHYIDEKYRYHIRHSRNRTPTDVIAIGFTIEARSPGEYPVYLMVVTEEGDGSLRQPLTVVVE